MPARTTCLAAKWSLSRRLLRESAEDDLAIDQVVQLEWDVLDGAIGSVDDALAKLHAVGLAFTEGERSDGADATALRQVIHWMRAYSNNCQMGERPLLQVVGADS